MPFKSIVIFLVSAPPNLYSPLPGVCEPRRLIGKLTSSPKTTKISSSLAVRAAAKAWASDLTSEVGASTLMSPSKIGLIVILNSRALVTFYLNFIDTNDLYESYLEKENGLSISGVIILASIFIFSLIFLYNKNWKTNFPKLTHLLLVSIVFRILSVVWFGEFFRLSMYFSVFDILLIPEACTTSIGRDNSMPSLKSFIVSVILCLYWLISI